MTALQRMIAGQGDALRALAETDVSAAAERLRAAPRIALVGTGTSHHASQLGAWLLRHGGVRARAVRAADFARSEAVDPQEAVILITHTGETAFALAARDRLRSAGAPLVSITGPAPGWEEAILTPVKEESETYTVSYTAALGVLGLLGHALAGVATGADAIRETAQRVDAVLADPQIDHVPVPARALALVGAGPWAVTAREGALKLREGARLLCEGFDAEQLLHGAAVPYGPADGIVLLAPDADPDRLLSAVGEAAAAAGIPVTALAESPGAASPEQAFVAQIPLTVRLQCLAARFAALRATDPDVAITGAWSDPALWAIGAPAAS